MNAKRKVTLSPRIERFHKRYIAFSVVFTTFILFLLMVEGAAFVAMKLRGTPKPNAPLLKFDYAPYRMMKTVQAPWPINEAGFRAKPLQSYLARPDESFRIVFLGGSVCAGYGGDTGPVLPDLLQERLHELGLAGTEVINLAQGGAVSAQELAILIQYGLKLQPEIVISFNGVNDLGHPSPIGSDEEPNLPYFDARMREMWQDAKRPSFWSAFYTRTSTGQMPARIYHKLLRAGFFGGSKKKVVPVDGVVASYVRTMDLTRRLTAAYGIKHVVVLQPVALVKKPMSPEELRYVREFDLLNFQERFQALYQKSAEALHSLSPDGEFRTFYDLAGAFRDEERTVYLDGTHFVNRIGYPRLLEVLEEQGLIEQISREYRRWAEGRDTFPEPTPEP